MKVTINGKSYDFIYGGFGPLYTFELIAKTPFVFDKLRDLHLLMFSTLLYCNPDTFKVSLQDFFTWLYDNPASENAMADEIVNETKRRNELVEIGKKKEAPGEINL